MQMQVLYVAVVFIPSQIYYIPDEILNKCLSGKGISKKPAGSDELSNISSYLTL